MPFWRVPETYRNLVSKYIPNNKIILVLTYHPFNFKVRDVIRKSFHILEKQPWNVLYFLP